MSRWGRENGTLHLDIIYFREFWVKTAAQHLGSTEILCKFGILSTLERTPLVLWEIEFEGSLSQEFHAKNLIPSSSLSCKTERVPWVILDSLIYPYKDEG